MSELDRRFAPAYRPSPGGVYPALAALVGEGLLELSGAAGRRQIYQVTEGGRAALAQRRGLLAAFEVRTGARLGTSLSLDDAIERLRVRVAEVAERVDVEEIERALDHAASSI